jgi:hypothetical protein
MNKRGSAFFVYFMLGIVFFLLGLALAPALTQTTGEAQTELDCSNESISNQNKAVCYQTDSMAPLFIGAIFGFAGIILGRLLGF